MIETDDTRVEETPRPKRRGFAEIVGVLSAVSLCVYLLREYQTGAGDPELPGRLDKVIFLDFFGAFLVALLFRGTGDGKQWSWPPTGEMIGRFAIHLVLIAVASYFMIDLAGPKFTAIWCVGLAAAFADLSTFVVAAILRVVWAFVSAFLAALVASMAGVPQDAILETHAPTFLGWGLLYFGGVAIYRAVRFYVVRFG